MCVGGWVGGRMGGRTSGWSGWAGRRAGRWAGRWVDVWMVGLSAFSCWEKRVLIKHEETYKDPPTSPGMNHRNQQNENQQISKTASNKISNQQDLQHGSRSTYMEIEQGEAECDEGKEVGFQNESGMLPAKAAEDETDGEMSATLLAKAAGENEVADAEVDGAEAAEDDEKQRCLNRLQSGTILPGKNCLRSIFRAITTFTGSGGALPLLLNIHETTTG
jgi:hypothetical protein